MRPQEMTKQELAAFKAEALKQYEDYKALGLSLNMARGKPGAEQLALSAGLLDCLTAADFAETDKNIFNYGGLDGIKEAKELFAPMLGLSPENVIVFGNSSLNIMYDCISRCYTFGAGKGLTPWKDCGKVKWLCPVPGYDRHFAITELFGFEMINVPVDENGPDMDMIERLVAEDESIKGIWCVPMYANPTGITYSDETVRRMAALKPAAKDFRIFWDNAYCIHHLTDTPDKLLNLYDELAKNGSEDMVYMFASTSKVTFPGSGVAVMGASKANLDFVKSTMTIQTIGHDKLNMLRHVRFFGGKFENVTAHMQKHRAVLEPRFKVVVDTLERELGGTGMGSWHSPNGGYFVSFNGMNGTAKRIVQLCKEAGVTLTGAGATFPYGKDPDDKNIRIAPTFPSVEELQKAMDIFVLAVKLASAEVLGA
ncbi:DNA-binding transcriptional regulator, MocR family, contains an aminotransferase domain [Ruminococcus sp. YE71]|uniref:aminotransferase class I/II-fold pyridoxal phosphate-dependent enzyme n=1 Tax=unclassified Ruminococcus TaxID=2608920 RepID=UPI000892239A|nr:MULTISPECIES: aminotransferase class I/II-fold pyridoxal phosphate-dependent enzyme [unclassified Ruminococcus]SDA21933.1 DNA-binding transcriptional regulator, MocR family, contains an aminotransferase domain [Ruminococcus sp. YE78]SFW37167.1 DNA-binding transcriptional regulator, MocR family, contains an aminotransferase domain [Ruminococcus sp. YE71]